MLTGKWCWCWTICVWRIVVGLLEVVVVLIVVVILWVREGATTGTGAGRTRLDGTRLGEFGVAEGKSSGDAFVLAASSSWRSSVAALGCDDLGEVSSPLSAE